MFEVNRPKQKPVVVIRAATSKEFFEYKQKLASGSGSTPSTTNSTSGTL